MSNKATPKTDIGSIDDLASIIASMAMGERNEIVRQVLNAVSHEERTEFLNAIAEIEEPKIEAIANTASSYIEKKGIGFVGERPDCRDQPGLDPRKSRTLLADPGAYNLPNVLKKLVYNHRRATFSIFASGGQLVDPVTNTMVFPIIILAVTSQEKKPAPSIVAVPLQEGDDLDSPENIKVVEEKYVLQKFKHSSMKWNEVPGTNGRVFVLESGVGQRRSRTSAAALSEDAKAGEEHSCLFTQKVGYENGKIFVDDVDFTIDTVVGDEPITGRYMKGDGLEKTKKDLVDDYRDEIPGNNDDEKANVVVKAIRDAFRSARTEIRDNLRLLHDEGYNEQTLNTIQVYKIYPESYEGKRSPVWSGGRFYGNASEVFGGAEVAD